MKMIVYTIFIFLFMSLLRAGIYFMFLKNVLKQSWKSFNTKFRLQWKELASKANFSTFLLLSCSNFKLKLCKRHWSDWKFQWNHVWRCLRWSELKHCSQRRSFTKYFRQTLVFTWDSKIQESFNFYFSAVIC